MSDLKYCQGPDCHTYTTQDRLKGPKGNKTYQTRRRSSFYYMGGNACSTRCEADWFQKYGTRAVDYFGRLTEPKKLTEENKGNCKLLIHLKAENGSIQRIRTRSISVNPTHKFIIQLREIFSSTHVWIS